MKILLTNDDGYQAPNIQNLFRKLSENHDVWIIAPENNCSGMSAAISFLKDTEIRQVEERIYAVDGTPADCTYFGLLGIVDFEFDMVVSGINHGANLGTDVIYSGTVGAAVGGRGKNDASGPRQREFCIGVVGHHGETENFKRPSSNQGTVPAARGDQSVWVVFGRPRRHPLREPSGLGNPGHSGRRGSVQPALIRFFRGRGSSADCRGHGADFGR